MKKDYSEFLVILDRSGSMQAAASDHEGGLNSFIQDQRKLEGDARITLIQFDSNDPCEVIFDGIHVEKAGNVTLLPRGGTPLLDAVGMGVAHFSKRLESQQEKPDIVVVMVITDGLENSSMEWTKERIKNLIAEKEKLGWKFLYLGANVDAFAEAGAMGISSATAIVYHNDRIGTRNMYANVTSGAVCARLSTQMGQDSAQALSGFDWTAEQRLAAIGKGSCTCIGTPNGDPNCPIHKKEVLLKGGVV